jgi:hypothetical protein
LILHRPPYSRRNIFRHPLDRRLRRPKDRSGRHGEEKNLTPTETRTPTTW